MSVQATLSPNPNFQTPKNTSHRRNDSGELDVFEAARYFSSENPAVDDTRRVHRSARTSLDVPIFRNPIHPGIDFTTDPKKGKKFKQPSSPGARLASFLNSLFSQTASKKKKKSKSSGGAADDEDSGRRKRRSSVSHFRIITENLNSSTSITPTKFCKEMRNASPGIAASNFERLNAWKPDDQKSRLSNGSVASFARNGWSLGFSDRNSIADRDFRKFGDVDDGADTDSSSDLFDLPNHELDFCSNGLPVYGTTNMDRIRIVAPISSTI